jgi:hypothetical protein
VVHFFDLKLVVVGFDFFSKVLTGSALEFFCAARKII